MTKKLLVVFASGLVLSILLLSAAWVIGGKDMLTRIDHDGGFTLNFDGDDDNGHLAMTSRSLAFNDSTPLEINAPVRLHFTRGDKVEMTVKGPQKLVEAVRWENGRLSLKDQSLFSHHTLTVNITAPKLPALIYKGAGNIELDGIDQPELAVEMAGAGNLDANGKVERLTVNSRGAGNLDFEELAATDATVAAAGVGNIDISATGKVEVTVSGVGKISLHRKPAELTSHVSGIGSVNEDY